MENSPWISPYTAAAYLSGHVANIFRDANSAKNVSDYSLACSVPVLAPAVWRELGLNRQEIQWYRARMRVDLTFKRRKLKSLHLLFLLIVSPCLYRTEDVDVIVLCSRCLQGGQSQVSESVSRRTVICISSLLSWELHDWFMIGPRFNWAAPNHPPSGIRDGCWHVKNVHNYSDSFSHIPYFRNRHSSNSTMQNTADTAPWTLRNFLSGWNSDNDVPTLFTELKTRQKPASVISHWPLNSEQFNIHFIHLKIWMCIFLKIPKNSFEHWGSCNPPLLHLNVYSKPPLCICSKNKEPCIVWRILLSRSMSRRLCSFPKTLCFNAGWVVRPSRNFIS